MAMKLTFAKNPNRVQTNHVKIDGAKFVTVTDMKDFYVQLFDYFGKKANVDIDLDTLCKLHGVRNER